MPYEKNDIEILTLDFEEITVGQNSTFEHVITEGDVQAFANLTGDFNPLHTDSEFAKTTMFQKQVVHGMLSASFISTIIGTSLPGSGALWMSQTLEFVKPAFIGDKISIKAKVKQKSPSTRIVILEVVVYNQNNELLIRGESSVKLLELTVRDQARMERKKKVVLVLGGSGGIGEVISKQLAIEGYKVVINFHNSENNANNVVDLINKSGGDSIAIKADVANNQEVAAMFDQIERAFGAVEAVVHCASPNNEPRTIENLEWVDIQDQIDVNLKGAFNVSKRALPSMITNNSGVLIFIGTIFTKGVPPTQQARYIVAKAALIAFGKCLAVEYGPSNIRVNTVSPGMTQTRMISNIAEKVKMLTKMQTPLRKLAIPEEIADTVLFLVSDRSSHITGQNIHVSGGAVMS